MTTRLRKVQVRGRQGRLDVLARTLAPYLTGSVLDVGCAERFLAPHAGDGLYVGLDLAGRPDVMADVEAGLPFASESFETVLALDVLEHLERIHFVFDEACRVARRYVVISLPNLYEWHFRLMILMGRETSGKYGLPVEPPPDRHRWFYTLDSALKFTAEKARANSMTVVEEILAYQQYRRWLARGFTALGRALGRRFAPLFTHQYWAVLERRPEAAVAGQITPGGGDASQMES
jgi:hypothetical protein